VSCEREEVRDERGEEVGRLGVSILSLWLIVNFEFRDESKINIYKNIFFDNI